MPLKRFPLFLFLHALLFSALPASEVSNSASDAESPVTLQELLDDSELWSFNVRVDPDKVAPALRRAASFPAVLLRIEEGKALVDFGRDGVHPISIEDTDLLENAGRIKRGEAELDLPNFTRYTTNIFFRLNENDQYRPYPVDQYASNPLYLLVYGDPRLVEEPALFEAVDTLFAKTKEKGGMGVVIPTSHSFYGPAMAKRIEWVMPFPHSRIAYVDALHHYPKQDAITLVLVDAYGKILRRSIFAYEAMAAGLTEDELAKFRQFLNKIDKKKPELVPEEF